MVRKTFVALAALLPLLCASCGDIHKHTTPMIECLRHVENHTPPGHRAEVARRECGWSPGSGTPGQARGDEGGKG